MCWCWFVSVWISFPWLVTHSCPSFSRADAATVHTAWTIHSCTAQMATKISSARRTSVTGSALPRPSFCDWCFWKCTQIQDSGGAPLPEKTQQKQQQAFSTEVVLLWHVTRDAHFLSTFGAQHDASSLFFLALHSKISLHVWGAFLFRRNAWCCRTQCDYRVTDLKGFSGWWRREVFFFWHRLQLFWCWLQVCFHIGMTANLQLWLYCSDCNFAVNIINGLDWFLLTSKLLPRCAVTAKSWSWRQKNTTASPTWKPLQARIGVWRAQAPGSASAVVVSGELLFTINWVDNSTTTNNWNTTVGDCIAQSIMNINIIGSERQIDCCNDQGGWASRGAEPGGLGGTCQCSATILFLISLNNLVFALQHPFSQEAVGDHGVAGNFDDQEFLTTTVWGHQKSLKFLVFSALWVIIEDDQWCLNTNGYVFDEES